MSLILIILVVLLLFGGGGWTGGCPGGVDVRSWGERASGGRVAVGQPVRIIRGLFVNSIGDFT